MKNIHTIFSFTAAIVLALSMPLNCFSAKDLPASVKEPPVSYEDKSVEPDNGVKSNDQNKSGLDPVPSEKSDAGTAATKEVDVTGTKPADSQPAPDAAAVKERDVKGANPVDSPPAPDAAVQPMKDVTPVVVPDPATTVKPGTGPATAQPSEMNIILYYVAIWEVDGEAKGKLIAKSEIPIVPNTTGSSALTTAVPHISSVIVSDDMSVKSVSYKVESLTQGFAFNITAGPQDSSMVKTTFELIRYDVIEGGVIVVKENASSAGERSVIPYTSKFSIMWNLALKYGETKSFIFRTDVKQSAKSYMVEITPNIIK
jgi:hypothetical protein